LASSQSSPVWVVIPAAGRGARMGGDCPKQYLPLAGKTILQVTLEKMQALPQLAGVVLALSPADTHWAKTDFPEGVDRIDGGKERADSVLNALNYLYEQGIADDHWVLVHDAARPCVQLEAIARLREQVERATNAGTAVGGILAKPVADTLKSVTGDSILATVDRSQLWQAHTPQMFRLAELRQALSDALEQCLPITDEASAMELKGIKPLVVEDRRDNIKVTHPEDLPLAEMILRQQLHTLTDSEG
jgi:2-C-methyl-D-erythritol 4-phosphate cytidylyltransferase